MKENNLNDNVVKNKETVLKETINNSYVGDDKYSEISSRDHKNKLVKFLLIIIILLVLAGISWYFFFFKSNLNKHENNNETQNNQYLSYSILSNSLDDFDFSFLKLDNNGKNKVYSPLSIKYTLAMLEAGANGETKEQISNVIGNYKSKKYTNSENLSLANALFVKNSFKESINDKYINTIRNDFNGEVIYDSFSTPNKINSWINDRTLGLIDGLFDDVSTKEFILVNALAIDMEWVKPIQPNKGGIYYVTFPHENFSAFVDMLGVGRYHKLEFGFDKREVKSVQISAVANKYDIVNVLGEQNIRDEVGKAYIEWMEKDTYTPNKEGVNEYLDKYIKEINTGYKHISSSTDFSFYVDDDIKVFEKDLKEYNGTTLQYIGIMPTKQNLKDYIDSVGANKVNDLINKLKPIELDSFKEGVITKIIGYIPMFKYESEINLIEQLKELGIKNVFNMDKADLSNLTSAKVIIGEAKHKATIDFSNDGIKASAVTTLGGMGAATGGFRYDYDVPVEIIDLTFDKPYLFIIRDKETGEVWFTGTVYEPAEYSIY